MSEIFELEKFEPSQLPELAGLKEKQLQIVQDNPFVEIIDNSTFEAAKKARTQLVSARTDIEKQDKLIASKIKKFREAVAAVSGDLIAITKPHEEKQQAEVRRYEAIKEAERAEKERIEAERVEGIKNAIRTLNTEAMAKIEKLQFDGIDALKKDFEENLFKTDTEQFAEFVYQFSELVHAVQVALDAKVKVLEGAEAQRIEAARIAKEMAKFEKERAEYEAKVKADQERAAAEQKAAADKLAAEQKRIADEQKAAQDKIDAERAALEAEKAAAEKLKADEAAKIEAEKKAAEQAEADRIKAEAEAVRLEELKPEKEKLTEFAQSLAFTAKTPKIKNEDLKAELLDHLSAVESLTKAFIDKVNNFK